MRATAAVAAWEDGRARLPLPRVMRNLLAEQELAAERELAQSEASTAALSAAVKACDEELTATIALLRNATRARASRSSGRGGRPSEAIVRELEDPLWLPRALRPANGELEASLTRLFSYGTAVVGASASASSAASLSTVGSRSAASSLSSAGSEGRAAADLQALVGEANMLQQALRKRAEAASGGSGASESEAEASSRRSRQEFSEDVSKVREVVVWLQSTDTADAIEEAQRIEMEWNAAVDAELARRRELKRAAEAAAVVGAPAGNGGGRCGEKAQRRAEAERHRRETPALVAAAEEAAASGGRRRGKEAQKPSAEKPVLATAAQAGGSGGRGEEGRGGGPEDAARKAKARVRFNSDVEERPVPGRAASDAAPLPPPARPTRPTKPASRMAGEWERVPLESYEFDPSLGPCNEFVLSYQEPAQRDGNPRSHEPRGLRDGNPNAHKFHYLNKRDLEEPAPHANLQDAKFLVAQHNQDWLKVQEWHNEAALKVERFCREHGYRNATEPRYRLLAPTKYPIHTAAKLGDAELVRMLLKDGADPAVKTSRGQTAAQIAREKDTRGSHNDVLDALAAFEARRNAAGPAAHGGA